MAANTKLDREPAVRKRISTIVTPNAFTQERVYDVSYDIVDLLSGYGFSAGITDSSLGNVRDFAIQAALRVADGDDICLQCTRAGTDRDAVALGNFGACADRDAAAIFTINVGSIADRNRIFAVSSSADCNCNRIFAVSL